jgi:putative ABC transport system ATP-binding protein
MIELQGIHKAFPRGSIVIQALRGVDLQIRTDDFLAIQGPSGAGKSTLLHIVGLLDTPTTGRVLLNGKDVCRLSDAHRSHLRNQAFGFVFQRFNLIATLPAWRNVALPGRYGEVGRRQRRARALALLDSVGLIERASHLPSQLSGGEEQRVAIARALFMNPQLLLADEPTGNLDSILGKQIVSLLSDVHERGTAIVVVTHEPCVVVSAQRAVRLVDGAVEESGQEPA